MKDSVSKISIRHIFNFIRRELARGRTLNDIEKEIFKQGAFNEEDRDVRDRGTGTASNYIFPFWV